MSKKSTNSVVPAKRQRELGSRKIFNIALDPGSRALRALGRDDKLIFCTTWLFILIAGRIIPHLPNMTPTLSLCVFGMWWLQRKFFFLFAIFAIEITDFLLSKLYGFNAFGSWTFFNDSAYLLIMLVTIIFHSHFQKFFSLQFFSLASCLFFWTWTNFGVFIFSQMYPHTLIGFTTCYVMALPFLKNALIADLIWMTIFWFGIYVSGFKRKEYLVNAKC